MTDRRVLVIGSQCGSPELALSFLPDAAVNLDDALRSPHAGGWTGALADESSLVLNPTLDEMDSKIAEAFANASRREATLLIAFVGHGEEVDGDFYLLPFDSEHPSSSRRSYLVGQRVLELLREHSSLDGLVLLVDACQSGVGAVQAADKWVRTISKAGCRFEMLTASDHRAAAKGCFTRTITKLILTGHPGLGEYLRCEDLKAAVSNTCPGQVAQRVAYDGRVITDWTDAGLWLARNADRQPGTTPLVRSPANTQVERLLEHYEATDDLRSLVGLSLMHRGVAVVGPPGRGKSALIAALTRPHRLHNDLPDLFAQAVLFASRTDTAETLAHAAARQLERSVAGFAAAARSFKRCAANDLWPRMDAWQRRVAGPLQNLETHVQVRLAIDGLDELEPHHRRLVVTSLGALMENPLLPTIRLIVSSRSEDLAPADFTLLRLAPALRGDVTRYVHRRGITGEEADAVVSQANGNWLIVRLYTEGIAARGTMNSDRPARLDEIYDAELRTIREANGERWEAGILPVLTVLAASGSSPVLPLQLLADAAGQLGGPRTQRRIRDVLVQLRGLVLRGQAGTSEEQVGLFHSTFRDYLRGSASLQLDVPAAHGALVAALAQRAPATAKKVSGSLHQYARTGEAEHLWALGRAPDAVASLESRVSAIPVENLRTWQSWCERLTEALGDRDETVLRARRNAANWQGTSGGIDRALQELHAVLDADEHHLGMGHPETIRARRDIANWVGESGQVTKAREMFRDLPMNDLPDRDAEVDRIRIRHGLACWTGMSGDVSTALRQFEVLLPDTVRVLGPYAPETVRARHHIARWTGHTGQFERARDLYQRLVQDQRQWLAPNDPEALVTRDNLSYWMGRSGDIRGAIRQLESIVADWDRSYGKKYPEALTTRHNLAYWYAQCGRAEKSLKSYQVLLRDQLDTLGSRHPATLRSRHNIAQLIGELGRPREAQELLYPLLTAQQEILGEDNPSVLRTLHSIAQWKGAAGDVEEALSLLHGVLANQRLTLGSAHPATYSTEQNMSLWMAEAGDPEQAQDRLAALLTRQRATLGPGHLDVLTSQGLGAHVAGLCGEIPHCLEETDRVVAELKTRFAHHPVTLKVQHNGALWRMRVDREVGRAELKALLPAVRRTFGPQHPFSLKAAFNLSLVGGSTSYQDKALAMLSHTLEADHSDLRSAQNPRRDPVWERIFAPDHPLPLNRRVVK